MYRFSQVVGGTITAVVIILGSGQSALAVTTVIDEMFDVDPDWEGFNNLVPNNNFAWSNTNNTAAPSGAGEIGGQLAADPRAYFAAETGVLDPLTDSLHMAGTIVVNFDSTNDGSAFLGFFDKDGLGTTNTPSSFLGFRFQNDPPYEIRLLAQPASNNIFQQDVIQFVPGSLQNGVPFDFEFDYTPPTSPGFPAEVAISFNGSSPQSFFIAGSVISGYASTFDRFGWIGQLSPGISKYIDIFMDDASYTVNETVAFPLGDFDRDNDVDDIDFNTMKANWLTTGHDKNELGEVTGDGIVDLNDFKLFKEQLYNPPGAGSGASLAIPEPCSFVLLAIAAPLALSWRRHGKTRCNCNADRARRARKN